MKQLLFLLLPVAAFSGWYIGNKTKPNNEGKNHQDLFGNYYKGLNYLVNEQPDKALDTFLQIFDVNDDVVELHLALGNLFRRQGKVDRAIRIHTSLLARPALAKAHQATALLELSKDYIKAGMLDRAENLLLELLNKDKYLEASLKQLIDIYQQAKDWQRAIEIAQRLNRILGGKLKRKIAHFYCELAEQKLQQAEVKAAQKLLKQAYNTDQNCARINIIEGNIAQDLGKFKRALLSYQLAIKQNKNLLSEVLPSLSLCYNKVFDSNNLLAYLQKLIAETEQRTTNSDLINLEAIGNTSVKGNAVCAGESNNNYIAELADNNLVLSFVDLLKKVEGDSAAAVYLERHVKKHPSIVGLHKLLKLNMSLATGKFKEELQTFCTLLEQLLSDKPKYKCHSCGLVFNTMQWHCPSCKQWDTLVAA